MPNTTELAVRKTTELTTLPPLRVSLDDPTADAKTIWPIIFPTLFLDWPEGLTVRWARYGRRTDYYEKMPSQTSAGKYRHVPRVRTFRLGVYRPFYREVVLNLQYLEHDPPMALSTLVHELVHVAGYDRHNSIFYRVQNEALARLGLPLIWRLQRLDSFGDPLPLREKMRRRCGATLPLWEEARP